MSCRTYRIGTHKSLCFDLHFAFHCSHLVERVPVNFGTVVHCVTGTNYARVGANYERRTLNCARVGADSERQREDYNLEGNFGSQEGNHVT